MIAIKDYTIFIRGLRVHYRTSGDPQNTHLILLNGWGARVKGGIINSEKVIRGLTKNNFYVISPEHPGLMRSEAPKDIWGYKEYREYLREFIEKLNITKPVILGQSFGGAIATAYAGEYSDKINTLILVSPGISIDKKYRFVFKHFVFMRYINLFLESPHIAPFFKMILISVGLGVPWDILKNRDISQYKIMGKIFSYWSLPNIYFKIRAKTILIWGRNDMLFPLSSAKEVAEEISGAKLYTLFGGHSMLYTQPGKIIKLIRANVRNG